MLLVFVLGVSLGVVAIAVVIDATTSYLAELPPREKKYKPKKEKKAKSFDLRKTMSLAIAKHRQSKRSSGLHRRTKVAF